MSDFFGGMSVGVDVRSLCTNSATGTSAMVPAIPLLAREIATRIAGDAAAFGFMEQKEFFAIRVDAGRYRFGEMDDLRELVQTEVFVLGDEMIRLGKGTPGCAFYLDEGSGDMKANLEFQRECSQMLKGGTRYVTDMTREVSVFLEKISLFKGFNPATCIPMMDGVWDETDVLGGFFRSYAAKDRFMGWLPISYNGPVNDVALRATKELCGDYSDDVLDALAESLVVRRKQCALLLYGPDGGEGKTTTLEFFEAVVGILGATGGNTCRGNVLDDDKYLFGDGDSVHPSAGFGFVGCSAMLLPDLADKGKVNLGSLVKVVAGSVISVREMGRSYMKSGIKIPVTATLIMQSNSMLGMESVWSQNPVERRILGVHVEKLSERMLNEIFALEVGEREAASRGLLRVLLARVNPGRTWTGAEGTWEAWRQLLFDETDGSDSLIAQTGLQYTGDEGDILWLSGVYDWAEVNGFQAPQNVLRKLLETKRTNPIQFKVPNKILHQGPSVAGTKRKRARYVRGWKCEIEAGSMPQWLIETLGQIEE